MIERNRVMQSSYAVLIVQAVLVSVVIVDQRFSSGAAHNAL